MILSSIYNSCKVEGNTLSNTIYNKRISRFPSVAGADKLIIINNYRNHCMFLYPDLLSDNIYDDDVLLSDYSCDDEKCDCRKLSDYEIYDCNKLSSYEVTDNVL